MMILAWNGLHWGRSFSNYFEHFSTNLSLPTGFLIVLLLLPHLILEAVAYILAGLSGTFVSRGVTKYSVSSRELRQVTSAALMLLGASFVILTISVVVERYFVQSILR